MRKLATIAKIDNLEPIPKADRILKATIKGWECVVSKADGFNVGDKVIYVEVDSILPATKDFEFLKDRKYRVKTIKLRGQISQGLVLPMKLLEKPAFVYDIGADVTEELGIKKYDVQAQEEKKILDVKPRNKILKFLMQFRVFRKFISKFQVCNCKFPTEIVHKTDEERIQNLPFEFKEWQDLGLKFYATEKVDGCSGTYFLHEGKFGVCSRNVWLRKKDNSCYWQVAEKFHLKDVLKDLKKHLGCQEIAVQGEILGQAIQGNKYKIVGYDFYVFNIIADGIKLDQDFLETYCSQNNLKYVPTIYKEKELPSTIHDVVELSKGKSVLLETQEREGLVWRNYERNISFKAINPEFLLSSED